MTLIWDVQTAVKTALDAAVDVPVYDAGELVGDDEQTYITVGEVADDGDTATAEQEESSLSGTYWRNETGEVRCAIETWDGEETVAPLRLIARPLLMACISAIRGDQSLGGLLRPPGRADVTSIRLREGQTDRGALVQVGFTVRYSALLT